MIEKIPKRNNQGFTLIETLIAIFVLVVGIIVVLEAFPLGIQITKSGQMMTTATQLAQAKLEEEFSKLYSELSIGTTTEDYGAITDFEAYKRVTEISCLQPSDLTEVSCDYDLTSDPFPMKKVVVTVSWRQPIWISEKEAKLVTLVTKK